MANPTDNLATKLRTLDLTKDVDSGFSRGMRSPLTSLREKGRPSANVDADQRHGGKPSEIVEHRDTAGRIPEGDVLEQSSDSEGSHAQEQEEEPESDGFHFSMRVANETDSTHDRRSGSFTAGQAPATNEELPSIILCRSASDSSAVRKTSVEDLKDTESTTRLVVRRINHGVHKIDYARVGEAGSIPNDRDQGVALPKSADESTSPSQSSRDGSPEQVGSSQTSAQSTPVKSSSELMALRAELERTQAKLLATEAEARDHKSAADRAEEEAQSWKKRKFDANRRISEYGQKNKKLGGELKSVQDELRNTNTRADSLRPIMQRWVDRNAELEQQIRDVCITNSQLSKGMTCDRLESEVYKRKFFDIQGALELNGQDPPAGFETQNLIDVKDDAIKRAEEEAEELRTAWSRAERDYNQQKEHDQATIRTLERYVESQRDRTTRDENRANAFAMDFNEKSQDAHHGTRLVQADLSAILKRVKKLEEDHFSLIKHNHFLRSQRELEVTAQEQRLLLERQQCRRYEAEFKELADQNEELERQQMRREFLIESGNVEVQHLNEQMGSLKRNYEGQIAHHQRHITELERMDLEDRYARVLGYKDFASRQHVNQIQQLQNTLSQYREREHTWLRSASMDNLENAYATWVAEKRRRKLARVEKELQKLKDRPTCSCGGSAKVSGNDKTPKDDSGSGAPPGSKKGPPNGSKGGSASGAGAQAGTTPHKSQNGQAGASTTGSHKSTGSTIEVGPATFVGEDQTAESVSGQDPNCQRLCQGEETPKSDVKELSENARGKQKERHEVSVLPCMTGAPLLTSGQTNGEREARLASRLAWEKEERAARLQAKISGATEGQATSSRPVGCPIPPIDSIIAHPLPEEEATPEQAFYESLPQMERINDVWLPFVADEAPGPQLA